MLKTQALQRKNGLLLTPLKTRDYSKKIWERKEEIRRASHQPSHQVKTVSCYYAKYLLKDTEIFNIAQSTKPLRFPIEQVSDRTFLNFNRESLALPFNNKILIKVTWTIPDTRNASSSVKIWNADKFTLIWVKLVICKSFRMDNFSKRFLLST